MSVFEWRDAPDGLAYAVLGDPVGHSWSPAMHNAAFEALGMRERYGAIRVPSGELRAALERLAAQGARGVNITVPLKAEALAWASHPDALAVRVGAANTLDLAAGRATNTDVPGFREALEGLDPLPRSVAVLLGAGGAARAAAVALADAGFELRVFNRTRARAEQMLAELGLDGTVLEEPNARDAGVVVNATSGGLHGDGVAVDWDGLAPGAVAMDLAYGPAAEPFVRAATGRVARVADGKSMLVAQGALSFEWWTGIRAPREVMLRAIP
ncbi:MAG: shikimate dehydrogenase [Fimbriimonadaceae bacterium]|nr:shikimate dehydrogenase [Fimbriimonadaceae bacterium]